jgi:hypothetical protein
MLDPYIIITIIVCSTLLIKSFFLLCYYSKCSLIKVGWTGIEIERNVAVEPVVKYQDLDTPGGTGHTILKIREAEDIL